MSDYATLMRLRHACAGIVSLSNPDDFVSNGEWKRAVAELEAAFESYSPAVTKLTAERDAAEQWRVEVAEALGYLNRAEGQSGYEVAGPRVVIAAFRRIEGERDAARENHLKVMKQRDAAFSLLDSFRNAHVQEHRWGTGVCHLCLAAEKLTKP